MLNLAASGAALGSALSYAVGAVAQHRATQKAPRGTGLFVGLLGRLVTRPLWLFGLAADVAGLVLHVAALSAGGVALVQPLLVSGLLFALPVSVVLERRRPSLTDWSWAVAVVAALAVFLGVGQPTAGRGPADTDLLAALTLAGVAIAAIVIVFAVRVLPGHRAALLGLAAGLAYGLTASLLKQATTIGTGPHPFALVTSWPAYLLVAIGVTALVLTQAAYRAGPLAASLPALTIVDPVVAIAVGVLVFGEDLAHTGAALSVETLSFAVMALSAVKLARRADTSAPARRP